MTKVIVDDAFAPALQGFKNPLKLFDNSGRFLGHFVPSPSADEIRLQKMPAHIMKKN
jgi:hypothetical protein